MVCQFLAQFYIYKIFLLARLLRVSLCASFGAHSQAHLWKSETACRSWFSHHGDGGDQIQVVCLGANTFIHWIIFLAPVTHCVIFWSGVWAPAITCTLTEHEQNYFTAATFSRIAKTWKKSRYPAVSEWVDKGCCVQTMEHHFAIKRERSSPATKRLRGTAVRIAECKRHSGKRACCALPLRSLEKAKWMGQ